MYNVKKLILVPFKKHTFRNLKELKSSLCKFDLYKTTNFFFMIIMI